MQTIKTILKNIFLSKRAKALYWSVGMMLTAGIIDVAVNVFSTLEIHNALTVAIGLILAQCSKALNNYLTNK